MRTIIAVALMVLALPCLADGAKANTAQALAKRMHGYWGVSEKGAYNHLFNQAKKGGEVSEKMIAEIKKRAKKLSRIMVKHYSADGKSAMYTVNGKIAGTYKVQAVRLKESEIDIEFSSGKFGSEKGTVFVGEDFYAYVKKGMPRAKPFAHNLYTFVSITEAEAKDRINEIEKVRKSKEK